MPVKTVTMKASNNTWHETTDGFLVQKLNNSCLCISDVCNLYQLQLSLLILFPAYPFKFVDCLYAMNAQDCFLHQSASARLFFQVTRTEIEPVASNYVVYKDTVIICPKSNDRFKQTQLCGLVNSTLTQFKSFCALKGETRQS